MHTLSKSIEGVPNGAIYPKTFNAGDECPPELLEAAVALDALAEVEEPQGPETTTAGKATPEVKAEAKAPENK